MANVSPHSDDFMELLTDALRAGPGSPEWHQAVTRARQQGENAPDEYKLLWTAREHLASGKTYREVRPGPGFTRKVLESIERATQTRARKPLSAATVIAFVAIVITLAVAALVGYWIYRSSSAESSNPSSLSSIVFSEPVLTSTFDNSIPSDWKTFGALPLVADHGLKVGSTTSKEYVGGGIVSATPVGTGPFDIDVTYAGNSFGEEVVPEVFITDRPEFTADRAVTPHELVWLVQDGQAQVVLPGGKVAGTRQPVTQADSLHVQIAIAGPDTLVETNSNRLWLGASGMSADSPKYVGVRFLAKDTGKPFTITITSIRVQKPSPIR